MNRANGLALISLLALVATARAEAWPVPAVSEFSAIQWLALTASLTLAFALFREFRRPKGWRA